MARFSRKKLTLNKCASSIEVQQLESRTLPTGMVAVAVTATGDIIFTGDANPNSIDVVVDAAGVHVTGRSGTAIKFQNQTVAAGTAVTFQEPAVIRDVRVNLQAGNDSIKLSSRTALNITRNLVMDTGLGNDNIAVHAFAGITAAGDVRISTGVGNDKVNVESNGGLIHVKNNLTVDTAAGSDSVRLADAVKFRLVDDAASLTAVVDNSGIALRQKIRVGGHLNVTTGAGIDTVAVLGAEVHGNANLNTSVDRDVVGVSNFRVGGNFNLSSADTAAVQNLTVAGAFTIRGGDVNDRVAIDKTHAGSLYVNLLDGNDQLALGAKVVVSGSQRLNGGIGTNRLSAKSSLASATVANFQIGAVNTLSILDDVLAAIAVQGI